MNKDSRDDVDGGAKVVAYVIIGAAFTLSGLILGILLG